MKKLIYILVFAFGSCFVCNAENAASLFEEGNTYYNQGLYDSAITMYKASMADETESKGVYYNLGNAHFRLGEIGPSVLNYERALKIDPSDEDVIHNLAFANERTVDKVEAIPTLFLLDWWNSIVSLFTSSKWSWIALILVWVALVSFVTFLFFKGMGFKKLAFMLAIVALLLALSTAALSLVKNGKEQNEIYAIVMESSAYVKSSPDNTSTDKFILHEGTKVKVIDSIDDWNRIKLADGKEGWLKNIMIENI